ncbi:class I SAM-dependent methyltransferase [Psychromonas aquimarina]|uniref:class I SAM-dependent methyltransferase n=1 Tax=Psychromonas aquimarina TaxID=444919 RepID=UPI000407E46F|nr:class I SAM-dependent methyltransferase [Psychromonas aquimarina]
MHLLDKLKIKFYHHKRLKKLGNNRARVQGWNSTQSQQNRFQALCQQLDFTDKSILDLGCGYGDLKQYLDQSIGRQGGLNNKIASYLGIDQQNAFIKSAQHHFINSTNTEFIKADFSTSPLPKVDIIIASGSLNYRSRQQAYHQKLITAMYESARYAVAFNMLDSRYFTPGKLLISHDPQKVLKFCRSICTNSQLFDHYAKNDFTIIMKH